MLQGQGQISSTSAFRWFNMMGEVNHQMTQIGKHKMVLLVSRKSATGASHRWRIARLHRTVHLLPVGSLQMPCLESLELRGHSGRWCRRRVVGAVVPNCSSLSVEVEELLAELPDVLILFGSQVRSTSRQLPLIIFVPWFPEAIDGTHSSDQSRRIHFQDQMTSFLSL